ncbi:MAG: type 1 glutamine amidotransferase [Sphingomonadales bacterium]
MMDRPLIGVTASVRGGRYMWWCNRLAVLLAGGRAQRITVDDRPDMDRFQGFIIGGGDDITPTLYGDEIDPAIRIDPDRDRLEQDILTHAEDNSLPVLGICRGAQMINVHRGGTIFRDIADIDDTMPRVRTVLPAKHVDIRGGSRLARIMKLRGVTVNALHHQAISRLGRDLDVVAEDLWGIVQGVESTQPRFLIGVQWHPEFLFFLPSHLRLFRALVHEAGAGVR